MTVIRGPRNQGCPLPPATDEYIAMPQEFDAALAGVAAKFPSLVFVGPKVEAPRCESFVGGGPHLTKDGNAEVAKAIAAHFVNQSRTHANPTCCHRVRGDRNRVSRGADSGARDDLVCADPPLRGEADELAVTIDGKLDDAAWTGASPAVTLQFLWESQTGAKQGTRARVVWDAQALYVGFDADDADITARFKQRDDPTYQDDAVEIFINPDPKQEALYYGFEMNARGVLYDYLNYNSRTLFKRWDATGVKIATSLRGTMNVRTDTDTGWSLEAAIPWANFEELSRRPPVAGAVWKANFNRWDGVAAEPPHEHLVRSAER